MTTRPDPARLAEARRRAAEAGSAEAIHDANRILALDVLLEFVEGVYDGDPGQVAWALKWAENRSGLRPHEARLREDAWRKINDDADHERWVQLGLRR